MSASDEIAKKRMQLSPEQAALLEKRLRGTASVVAADKRSPSVEQNDAATISLLARQSVLDVDWAALNAEGQRQAIEGSSLLQSHNFNTLSQKLNRVAIAYVNNALIELGAFVETEERQTLDQLINRLNIAPDYRKVTAWWLIMLAQEGYLRREDDFFISPRPLINIPLDAIWDDVREASRDTGYEEILRAIKVNGQDLASIITGKKYALENFFSDGSSKVADQAYGLSPEANYFSGIMKAVLAVVIKALPAGRELRVLEIGAGVGGTTSALLPVLPASQTRYVFTDISPYFLENGRVKFHSFPFVQYALLNVDQDPLDQGFKQHTFDLVVASNVLHCSRFMGKALQHLRSLLNTSGTLMILEGTRNEYWHSIAMGLLKGFMNFEDKRLLTYQPFLSYEDWERELRANRFTEVAGFPAANSPADVLGQHVIIARAS